MTIGNKKRRSATKAERRNTGGGGGNRIRGAAAARSGAAGRYCAAVSAGSPDVTYAAGTGLGDTFATLILAALTAAGMAAALGIWPWSAA